MPKYKGAPEEIYEKFANSVVYIDNRKDKGSGSGFIINHKGLIKTYEDLGYIKADNYNQELIKQL